MTAKRILIVDDEPTNLGVIEAHLEGLGHTLIRADSGERALASFQASPPDLILLDLRMAGLDGLDVLTHVRAAERGSDTPVVMVTAHGDREHRLAALEAGADDFLEKPIDAAILRARVKTLLALKTARDEAVARADALIALQREQRELIEFVVHDLKNPLAGIDANVSFVRSALAGSDKNLDEALGDAEEGARRLARLVEDLLLVARLEHASFPLKIETIKVQKMLADVASTYRQQAATRRITLAVNRDLDVEVAADRNLLRRVLENIVDNAIRHTPEDGRVGFDAHGGATVSIAVSNTGTSIPAHHRAHIFDKFARAATSGSFSNVGLGLYFCRCAVEAQGGAIEVVETPEWPTQFVLRLPTRA